MTLVLRYSARSDRGLVRHNNQDAVYAGPRLLALADGTAGPRMPASTGTTAEIAGEVASSLVISALAPLDDDDPGDDLLRELHAATVEGNAAIHRHERDAPHLKGMGTTLTAMLFRGSRMGLVHVGDSRAYQLRDGWFSQITKDDTFVQSLIDEGRITEEEAHTHPQHWLLLRAITGQDVDPSLTLREARAGDRYLLCSDGLSGVVSEGTLAATLQTYADPRECADRLIELALRGGGPDNITCIVAGVVDVDFAEDAPIVGGAAGDWRPAAPPSDRAAARPPETDETGVFISYRRQDSAGFAGRLYDRLEFRFGRDAVFMDVDSIDLGLDFAEVIDESLARCAVVIVVIGRNWLNAADDRGRRRLDDPDDLVRLEIEAALERRVRVIPVLVDGAQLPDRTELPPSLAALTRRHGLVVSHVGFNADVNRLLETLDRIRAR